MSSSGLVCAMSANPITTAWPVWTKVLEQSQQHVTGAKISYINGALMTGMDTSIVLDVYGLDGKCSLVYVNN